MRKIAIAKPTPIRSLTAAQSRVAYKSLGDFLAGINKFLKENGIDHALIGGQALSTISPRSTKDVDFIVYEQQKNKLKGIIEALGLEPTIYHQYQLAVKDPESNSVADFIFTPKGTEPYSSAINNTVQKNVLGTPSMVVRPEYLLWLYCMSDNPKHVVDAQKLIKSGFVNLRKVVRIMTQADAHDTLDRLERILGTLKMQLPI